jgi:hypothetical protein
VWPVLGTLVQNPAKVHDSCLALGWFLVVALLSVLDEWKPVWLGLHDSQGMCSA